VFSHVWIVMGRGAGDRCATFVLTSDASLVTTPPLLALYFSSVCFFLEIIWMVTSKHVFSPLSAVLCAHDYNTLPVLRPTLSPPPRPPWNLPMYSGRARQTRSATYEGFLCLPRFCLGHMRSFPDEYLYIVAVAYFRARLTKS